MFITALFVSEELGRGPLNASHLGMNKENMVYTNHGMSHNN